MAPRAPAPPNTMTTVAAVAPRLLDFLEKPKPLNSDVDGAFSPLGAFGALPFFSGLALPRFLASVAAAARAAARACSMMSRVDIGRVGWAGAKSETSCSTS